MTARIFMLCLLVLASLCYSIPLQAQNVARLTVSLNVVPAVGGPSNSSVAAPVISTLLPQLLWSTIMQNQTLTNNVDVRTIEREWGEVISGACDSRGTKVTSQDCDCDAVLNTQVVVPQ